MKKKAVCPQASFWAGKKVFLTGTLGFKGSWLALYLKSLGASLFGYSLKPDYTPYLGSILDVPRLCDHHVEGNICDYETLKEAIHKFEPDMAIHMAAQPLVIQSYKFPLETVASNITGTANFLEGCRGVSSLKAILVVTTDKCYQNKETKTAYTETDPLGGNDVYSASKACAEILTHSYEQSFFCRPEAPMVATARAGNVIGGGDWSADRLIPDIVRSLHGEEKLNIRNTQSIRPWQHVAEPLVGYLMLLEMMLTRRTALTSHAYNFGPSKDQIATVGNVVELFLRLSKSEVTNSEYKSPFKESNYLLLDSTKALADLGWKSVFSIEEAVSRTVAWYNQFYEGQASGVLEKEMLNTFDSVTQKIGKSQSV